MRVQKYFKSLSVSFVLLSTLAYGQIDATSIYQKEFKTVGKNEYTRTLISSSAVALPKNWNNYQGGAINTDTSLYYFNDKKLYKTFPTNYALHRNQYLTYYFTLKEAKCPTLFSLANYYDPIVTPLLKAANLPLELNLLPAVCSAYNPYSSNGVGGEGFWHLNYPQAVRYGLEVSNLVDERRDFEKSTKAAILHLKHIYSIYNNWELTLTAYSCGVTTVNKYLKRTGGTSLQDIYTYLPEGTRDLVQAFVALNYLNQYDDFGVIKLTPKIEQDTVKTSKELHFKALTKMLNIDSKTLTFLNITINRATFPKNSTIVLPKDIKDQYLTLKDSIFKYQDSVLLRPKPTPSPVISIPKDGNAITYRVRSGDVLGAIAERHNVSVRQLQNWNNLRGTRINVGQELTVYGKKKVREKKEKKKKENIAAKVNRPKKEKPITEGVKGHSSYTVKSGDSLWIIAKKYPGVSAQNIMSFNNINSELKVGQVLKIPQY